MEDWRPPAVTWCPRSSICIMDLPALRTILFLHANGLARSCGQRGSPYSCGQVDEMLTCWGNWAATWCHSLMHFFMSRSTLRLRSREASLLTWRHLQLSANTKMCVVVGNGVKFIIWSLSSWSFVIFQVKVVKKNSQIRCNLYDTFFPKFITSSKVNLHHCRLLVLRYVT